MNTWADAYKKKLIIPQELPAKTDELKKKGLTLATLNGSFDLLHAGHLEIIYQASLFCDRLLLLLNSDSSIRKYKGCNRPIIALNERLQMAAALEFVDYLTWFDETDPRNILSKIAPNVHVNGAEYGAECIEAETVSRLGGKIALVPRIDGLSTSNIIKRIQCV